MLFPILEAMTTEQILDLILILGVNLGAMLWVIRKAKHGNHADSCSPEQKEPSECRAHQQDGL